MERDDGAGMVGDDGVGTDEADEKRAKEVPKKKNPYFFWGTSYSIL